MAAGLIRCEHCGRTNRVPAAANGPLTFFTEPGQLRFFGLGSPAVPVWLIAPCSWYGLGGVAPGAVGA
jgi:hypothetical protein